MKNNKTRIVSFILLLFIAVTAFSGCFRFYGYKGPHPDMFSLILANCPETRGYWSDGEIWGDPEIEVIERDSFGRVLFYYTEERYYLEKKGVYIAVMQSADGESVSYYSEDCYIYVLAEVNEDGYAFDDETVSTLKELNDWEKPIDEARCSRTEIRDEREKGSIDDGDDGPFEEIIERYYERAGREIHPRNAGLVYSTRFVTADSFGRELYIVYSRFSDYTDKSEIYYQYEFLAVIMPDGSLDEETVIMLEDSFNSQSEAKLIKEKNNWNKPIE